jgi:hypothetical protein
VHTQVKSLGLGQAEPGLALIEGCGLGLGFEQAPSPQKLSPAWGLKPKPGLHITTHVASPYVVPEPWPTIFTLTMHFLLQPAGSCHINIRGDKGRENQYLQLEDTLKGRLQVEMRCLSIWQSGMIQGALDSHGYYASKVEVVQIPHGLCK